jgi:hypothetical protein
MKTIAPPLPAADGVLSPESRRLCFVTLAELDGALMGRLLLIG